MGGSTLLLLLVPPGSGPGGGTDGSGTAGAAQLVGPFGWGFYFTGAAPTPVPTSVSIRRAVRGALKADPSLAAVVGGRVFAGQVPDTRKLPAVVYRFGRIRRQHDLDGPTGIAFAAATFYAVAREPGELEAVAEAVRQVFDGFTGSLAFFGVGDGSEVLSGGLVEVLETVAGDESDAFTPPADNSGEGIFEVEMPYTFMYREPLPARMSSP